MATSDSKQRRALAFRGLLLVIVFSTGLIGFLAGVEVTERPGVATGGLAGKIYYTLSLFVLGGLDLGVPHGDPVWARQLLWFAYFAAPLLTASAVTEGLLAAINPEGWRLRGLRDHIVIGGGSRLAILYLRRLRESGSRRPVVIVDERADNPNRAIAQSLRARWIAADITRDDCGATLHFARARRILLLTGNDFANLDAASKVLVRTPKPDVSVIAHVGDLRFKQLLSADNSVGVEAFNIYQIAANELVETQILPYFKKTEFKDILVLSGFGRLGQTILAELQQRVLDQLEAVVIIDTDANDRVLDFDEQIGFAPSYERHVIEGDANSLSVWAQVESLYDFNERGPAFLLVSGDDGLNLRIALRLSQRYPNARTLTRSYYRSPFAEHISTRSGFETFSLAELIHDSMQPSWFD